jgi:hypothetical protein
LFAGSRHLTPRRTDRLTVGRNLTFESKLNNMRGLNLAVMCRASTVLNPDRHDRIVKVNDRQSVGQSVWCQAPIWASLFGVRRPSGPVCLVSGAHLGQSVWCQAPIWASVLVSGAHLGQSVLVSGTHLGQSVWCQAPIWASVLVSGTHLAPATNFSLSLLDYF